MSQAFYTGNRSRETLLLRRIRRARFGAGVYSRGATPKYLPPINLGESIKLRLHPDWRIRDQGELGACVAFAAVACVEYYIYERDKELLSLSEQFVFAKIKELQRVRHKDSDRTWLSEAAEVLKTEGVCLQVDYPQDPLSAVTKIPANAPSPAELEVQKRRFVATVIERPQNHGTGPANYIINSLRRGVPVAISIPVQVRRELWDGFLNWTTRKARFYGIVEDPTGDADDGHAVCLVGYQKDQHANGGGWFIVRNSWGLEWSSETPSNEPFAVPGLPGRGYGVISVGYVEIFCSEMMTIKEQIPDRPLPRHSVKSAYGRRSSIWRVVISPFMRGIKRVGDRLTREPINAGGRATLLTKHSQTR